MWASVTDTAQDNPCERTGYPAGLPVSSLARSRVFRCAGRSGVFRRRFPNPTRFRCYTQHPRTDPSGQCRDAVPNFEASVRPGLWCISATRPAATRHQTRGHAMNAKTIRLWLRPGLRIKRWVGLFMLALILTSLGAAMVAIWAYRTWDFPEP